MANEKKNSKTNHPTVKAWVQGRSFLTLQFFKRNFWYIVAITAMLLMSINLKYVCQDRLASIIKLSEELNDAKTDCVNASARYNSKIRESEMKTLIDTNHIDLASPEQPPYKLSEK